MSLGYYINEHLQKLLPEDLLNEILDYKIEADNEYARMVYFRDRIMPSIRYQIDPAMEVHRLVYYGQRGSENKGTWVPLNCTAKVSAGRFTYKINPEGGMSFHLRPCYMKALELITTIQSDLSLGD